MSDAADMHDDQEEAGPESPESALTSKPLSGADDDFGLSPRPALRAKIRDPLLGLDLGGVRIERLIGEGGMGRVYRAQQTDPDRTVAVKVVRFGISNEKTLRRFGREAEFLSKLQHPGIAQILVVGTYESDFGDVPFFVMEYIPDAKPITRFARDQKLSLQDRLALFARVCDAVAHGHDRGVVHRDLKPGNILIDAAGQPKVIDFGVARSTDSDLTLTRHSDSGSVVGTVQYMAPEQFVDGTDAPAIDSRADVYSLGVVLHELVSGVLPYNLEGKAMHEASRVVCEEVPPSLKSRDKTCPRDVSLIAEHCLRKAPRERYRDAGELAEDVQRHLAGESLLHARPSVIGPLRRTVSRFRHWVAPTLAGLGIAAGVMMLVPLKGGPSGGDPSQDAAAIAERELLAQQEAEEAADPEKRRFGRVRRAVRDNTLEKTEIVGGVGFGYEYSDVPTNGGYLIGVRVSTGKFGPDYVYEAVGSIEAIYRTPEGDVFGERHGPIGGPLTEFRAKNGYALSGFVLHAPHRIEGFQAIFSRITDDGVDLEDSYTSDKYLLLPPDSPTLSTGGKLAVGLWGWWARDEVRGIGLYKLP